jgi:hypothetical protein
MQVYRMDIGHVVGGPIYKWSSYKSPSVSYDWNITKKLDRCFIFGFPWVQPFTERKLGRDRICSHNYVWNESGIK